MTEQNINPHLLNEESENTNGITLHDLIQMVLANWYWFALSAIICLGTAYYYLASTPKIYSRTATILVKDSRKGRRHGSGRVQRSGGIPEPPQRRQRGLHPPVAPADVGGGQAPPPLTVNYSVREGLRTADLYGRSPIEVDFINDNSKQKLSGGHPAQKRQDRADGLRGQVRDAAGDQAGHSGRNTAIRSPRPCRAGGRAQDPVHGLRPI